MKEIYLAMDISGAVFRFNTMPTIEGGVWKSTSERCEFVPDILKEFGISKDRLTHETPIKIRAVWEVAE